MNTLEYTIVEITNMELIRGLLTPKFGIDSLGLSLIDNKFDVVIVGERTPPMELVVLKRVFGKDKPLPKQFVLISRPSDYSPEHGSEFVSMKDAELALSRYLNPKKETVQNGIAV